MLHRKRTRKAGRFFSDMIRVHLICVGNLKEKYWRDACAEYEKRLNPFCKFTLAEIPEYRLPAKPSEAQIQAALYEEGIKIRAAAEGSVPFAMCIEGKELSSVQLAQKIEDYSVQGYGTLSFLIGSSYGLCESIKKEAAYRLSMSPMTFPHQLARVMLCEQIYRAFQIINHGKYHK